LKKEMKGIVTESKQSQSLTASAARVLAAKSVSFALSFALPLLLVRRLEQNEFGVYKQVFLLVDSAVMILPLGFYLTAFYFLPREPKQQPQIIFNILLFHVLVGALAGIVLVTRPSLAVSILNAPDVARLAPLIGITIFLWIASYFLETVAVAHQELRLAILFIVGSRLTKSGLLFAAALMTPTVEALIWAAAAQGALQMLALIVYLRSRFGKFWQGFQWSIMRAQLSYALPLGASAVILALFGTLNNYFVSHRFGSAAYAVYAVGCFTIPLIPLLSEAVGQVMLPRISLLQKQQRPRDILVLTARMMRKLALVYLPIYALMLVLARDFIVVLFTSQYAASWPIFAINLTLVPLGLVASAVDPVMRAYAEHRYYLLRVRLSLLVLMVGAVWVGLVLKGMLGAITAAVLVNFVERLVTARKVSEILGVTRRDWGLAKDVGKIAIAAAVAGVVAFILRGFLAGSGSIRVILACGATFSLVYLTGILLIGILEPDERDAIRSRLEWLLRRELHSRSPERLG